MKAFAELYAALDETTRTNEKVEALRDYFARAEPEDAAWVVYFLIGRKPRQVVPSKLLRAWAMAEAGIPEWLYDECRQAVGDSSETIALLLPPPDRSSARSLREWIEWLLALRETDEATRRREILSAWAELDGPQRLLLNKLIGGNFRVGVSQQLVTRALAKVSALDPSVIAHRMMGQWEPSPRFFEALCATDVRDADSSRPYPFCLAHPIEKGIDAIGDPSAWLAEWKWDGIRAQLIRREGETYLWTRGEELVTERYPELAELGRFVPDGTALDGEIMPWRDDCPLPFALLQKRIGRKTISKALLHEIPVCLIAYDLLEYDNLDIRNEPFQHRRSMLETLVEAIGYPERLKLSPKVPFTTWDELSVAQARSRDQKAEGLMLKRLDSAYEVGRKRGLWWKWKVEPFTVDAVLTAAQRGSGRRAHAYTDYHFSVWNGDRLVPFAKAYSGLTDAEIRRVDAFIRHNLVESFGPVRTVKPELVFELGFEGIQRSNRHKSGVAVRFPRIVRWREDKSAADADTLETIQALLPE